jgi:hypothetical protein
MMIMLLKKFKKNQKIIKSKFKIKENIFKRIRKDSKDHSKTFLRHFEEILKKMKKIIQ